MNQTQNGEAPAPDLSSLDGLTLLQAFADGRLPAAPIGSTLGMENFAVERGSATVELVPRHEHYNPLGSVHGGVISALLDTAAGCSVHSTLEAGQTYTSLDLSVKFLRVVREDTGRIRATGKVLHRGRRTALAEAELVDESGRLLAHATSSCLIT